MSLTPSNRVVWFAVLGGPLAWAVQFVANLALGFAQCNPPVPRWTLHIHAWAIGLSVIAIVIGLAATAVSLSLYLRTARLDDIHEQVLTGQGGRPPQARVHFLAIVGLVVNFLALAIVVMTGVGAPLLTVCRQS